MYFSGVGKKPLIFAAFTVTAVLAGIVYMLTGSASLEPKDFHGISWGASVQAAGNLKLVAGEGELAFYERPGDDLKVGETDVQRIVYGFHKDRFYNVMIYFQSASRFARIRESLARDLGDPFQPPDAEGKYFWTGDRVSLLLSFDKSTDTGRLVYFFKPLQLEAEMSS